MRIKGRGRAWDEWRYIRRGERCMAPGCRSYRTGWFYPDAQRRKLWPDAWITMGVRLCAEHVAAAQSSPPLAPKGDE